jgi:hypothetical protein
MIKRKKKENNLDNVGYKRNGLSKVNNAYMTDDEYFAIKQSYYQVSMNLTLKEFDIKYF